MKLKSKIRSIFTVELLDLIASICDTRRIDSLPQKMKILCQLLNTYGVKFEVLGGATNRIAMFIDGYAVKFAMDSQGYRDNLIEYSICKELQPYVTKSYETNGYIVVAECVRLMSESEFIARKQDILNILMTLADDYLLGDVGFLQKNRTNWGVRDNGELVILDYAYCHRATENLFTCPVCGEGVLTYTSVFDKLICTNRSVCHATFSYNQRKQEQGDQVDFDMIAERRSDSIVLRETEDTIDVGDHNNGKFMFKDGKKVVMVDNASSYTRMMEANKMISTQFDRAEALEALVQLSMTKDSDSVAREIAIQNLDNIKISDTEEEYVISEEYKARISDEPVEDEYDVEEDGSYGLDYLIALATSSNNSHAKAVSSVSVNPTREHDARKSDIFEDEYDVEEDGSYGLDYLIALSMKNNVTDDTSLDTESELSVVNSGDIQDNEENFEEPESEEPLNMTNGTENVTMNEPEDDGMSIEDGVEAVDVSEPQQDKIELSSMYGHMGNPQAEVSTDIKIGVMLDGESL